ncbi:exodeoxyribonuclease VII large subunit [Pseudomonas chlororaphis]|uniref:exodeoxyribonuclease VII large subunit n=1 Tax=Pseudomonas chlororaphis TaxID=587753 RepID=UPI00055DCF96|nr:exodeoxyribonuclease VII large subunit [Pseudomonas chlororaphis]
MNNLKEPISPGPISEQALTPEALSTLLKVTVPGGPVTLKGITSEVKYWSKAGESKVSRIYGRLVLGDASIRFELQPHTSVQDEAPVILHGTLRIKPTEAFRVTHEVILVGDVVGSWLPHDGVPTIPPEPLVRLQPRATLEAAVAAYGLESIAFLATGTAWQDMTKAALTIPEILQCRHIETNFTKPERFIEDVLDVCRNPTIKILVIARGGGGGLHTIGDSHTVAAALLASGRLFYTALGHDKNVMLLDKHADQPFATPSILGQALVEAVHTLAERKVLAEQLRRLTDSHEELRHENVELNQRVAQLTIATNSSQEYRIGEAEPPPYGIPNCTEKTSLPATTSSPHKGRARMYAIWAALITVVFLIGRCSA